jgi:hypothetical protein
MEPAYFEANMRSRSSFSKAWILSSRGSVARSRRCELELIVGWLDSLEAKIDLELSAVMRGVGEVGP